MITWRLLSCRVSCMEWLQHIPHALCSVMCDLSGFVELVLN